MTEPTEKGAVRRREFLKILGATTAAGAAAGCSPRTDKLIPYLVSPDNTVPGVSNYYSSTCRECAAACGILVETRDGRAIKIEGNVEHPLNRGALCARGQSALQGLYNPDRYRSPMIRRGTELVPITWEEAATALSQRLTAMRGDGGASNAAFINQHESGSFPVFLDEWLSAFGMPPHISYDAALDAGAIAANKESYGVAWPGLDFAAARLIISFGADFLETWGASVTNQLSFADARAKLADAPRFIYVGPRRSLTGLNADEWIDCKPGSELQIARALLRAVGGVNEGSIGPGFTIPEAVTASGVSAERLERLARELVATKPSLVVAGANSVHGYDIALTANAINQRVGNVGVTVKPDAAIISFEGAGSDRDVAGLASRMRLGEIPAVFIRGSNPAYTMPKSAQFVEALARVPFKVSFSSYPDETSALCDLILPDHHPLEQWGDSEPLKGTLSLQQPAMDPVFNTRASGDFLISIAKANPATAARYTVSDYRGWLVARSSKSAMQYAASLRTGVTAGTLIRRPPVKAEVGPPAPVVEIESTQGDFYFVTYLSPTLGEGRGTNKPWLQELPDPVSKICWQSWIEIHPETAERLGVGPGDHLTVQTDSGSITAPAYVYLGVRRDTVAMSLGQGHTRYGRYAENVGVNALDAQPASFDARSGALARVATKARVTKAGAHSPLVSTEGSARQHGRGIARAVAVAQLPDLALPKAPSEFKGDASHAFLPGLRAPVANDAQGELGDPASNQKGMYKDDHYSGMGKRRWAMTVDLARCTGCSACVTACYAENNIPTVGAPWQGPKIFPDRTGPGANILRSREMAWLRLERYFEGGEHGESDFETRFVPMMCQHCGNAPCEPVCPVFATYHAPDGLNVQVYNRCVGTRYCSNNCPYKVRYFNWFGYGEESRAHYAFPEPLNWQLNPDVTVRSKGVMEKCTFCVQRIRETESRAVLEGREMVPDEFTTACAQGCPSQAIVFGDAADPAWTVAKKIADNRGYHVFEELNTYTAVVYLQKVLHGAPALAPGGAVGAAQTAGGAEHGD